MHLMSYSSEQSPNAASTPFEQVSELAYEMHGRYQSHNTLRLPLFDIEENGIVVPVVSALSYEKRPEQDVRVEATDIAVYQRYYPLKVRATYIGLWQHGDRGAGSAALYNSELTFQPQQYGGTLPFRETLNSLLNEHALIEQTDEADIRGRDQNPFPYIRGTANTSLVPGNVGFNSVEGVRFWRPALCGEVEVDLAKDQLLKISDKTIWTAAKKTISLTLPGSDEQTIPDAGYHELTQDAELFLNNETGEVKTSLDDEIASQHPPYTLNPILSEQSKLIAEQAADQLEWEDVTHMLVMHNRGRFSKRLELSAGKAYEALHEQAVSHLVKARDGLCYEPLVVAAVLDRLGELRRQDVSDGGYLVTPGYTSLNF